MPTFGPGWTRVPHWRTRMFPARTGWPAKILTPRRCPALSRPFRVLPWPFLCAIVFLSAPLRDLGHAHGGDRLPVSVTAAVVLPPLLLVHEHLPRTTLLDDLSAHARAVDERRADAHRAVPAREQHLGELDRRADVAGEPLDAHDVAGSDAILLSTGPDDGVGHDQKKRAVLLSEAMVCT